MNGLVLEGVSHEFAGQAVLSDLSLAVAPGEVVAVMGPSGCGKTTLLRVGAGLLTPSRGTVERPLKMGMAFQEPRLLPWRSAIGNVLFGLEQVTSADRDRASQVLASLGLAGYEGYFPRALSGGMASRVSLARALLNRPELLLLDEPLAGMDYFGRTDLEERLSAIWQEERPAVLLVTHDPEEALYLADRIMILSRRPARVVAETRVALPRPRDRMGEACLPLRAEVMRALAQAGSGPEEAKAR